SFRAEGEGEGGERGRSTVVLIDDVTVEREVDRMKTDFISTVSHELRTPLTSVLGFAKIIQRRLDERVFPHVDTSERGTERAMRQVDENLEIILSEGGRLTALINDVLDISKMEARRVEWQDSDVDLGEVIETAVRSTSALFLGGDVEVVVEVSEGLPPVRGDKQRLVQVLINLLSNAQKFTREGTVTVGARPLDDDRVEVTVSDTGVGVAEDD
ncbi:MAG: hypothetical protein KDE23_27725, partial [Caldilinea sp.]|nr:hypothetical protein [Caldilinea sp.]